MKISYFQETDTLYFELDESTSVESNEVSPGVVFDFDQNNKIVGIKTKFFFIIFISLSNCNLSF